MDVSIEEKPQHFSRYGFESAPLSKFIILASGAATTSLLLIPDNYSSIFHLHWPFIVENKEVWRLVTSQFVYDSTAELLYGSVLLYHMRVLERQWGTRKFASFIFATYTLTLGSHFLGCYFDFAKSLLPIKDTMASGLYGPIFALIMFFMRDVHSSSVISQQSFSISNKWFTYFIAFRDLVVRFAKSKMMMVSKKSYVAAILGFLSGVTWSSNLFYLKSWLVIPNVISNMAQSVYDWFQVDDDKPGHRKTFYGATESIQDDMMYDFMSKIQATSARNGSRLQMGQGYSDTLQPRGGPMQEFLDSVRMFNRQREHQQQLNNFGNGRGENVRATSHENVLEHSAASQEDKIQRLMEMGFTRDAVVEALQNSGHDVQSATNALLSQ